VLKGHTADVLLAGGAFVANNTCFYVAITYAVAYGAATVGVAKEVMLGAVMVGSVVMIPVLVACGARLGPDRPTRDLHAGRGADGPLGLRDVPADRHRVSNRDHGGDQRRAGA
jgi:hypothetical protein